MPWPKRLLLAIALVAFAPSSWAYTAQLVEIDAKDGAMVFIYDVTFDNGGVRRYEITSANVVQARQELDSFVSTDLDNRPLPDPPAPPAAPPNPHDYDKHPDDSGGSGGGGHAHKPVPCAACGE